MTTRNVYRGGGKREGRDPIWAEPDWDAPYRRPADLLPTHARCGSCLYWFGACGLDTRRMRRAEDRCDAWQHHPDARADAARRAASWKPATSRRPRAAL